MDTYQRSAQQMEDFLFKNGGAEWFLLTLRYLRNIPSICELGVLKGLSNKGALTDYYTKEENTNDIIFKPLKDFLPMLCRTRDVKDNGEKEKDGGRQSLEDQNVYNAMMTKLKNDALNK